MLATNLHSSTVKNANDHQACVYVGGQIIGNEHGLGGKVYEVIAGEVVIISNGRMVDLVEAGEWLDDVIWPDATVVAWTDCVLMLHADADAAEALPAAPVFVVPTDLQKHLALAA